MAPRLARPNIPRFQSLQVLILRPPQAHTSSVLGEVKPQHREGNPAVTSPVPAVMTVLAA